MSLKATGLKVSFLSILFPTAKLGPDEALGESRSVRLTPSQEKFLGLLQAEGPGEAEAIRRSLNMGVEVGQELEPYGLMVIHAAQMDKKSINQLIASVVIDALEERFPGMSKTLGIKRK